MNNPSFSYTAIVTSYNSEQHIARCLLSILNQTVKPVQIILVDDCSTDSTLSQVSSIEFGNLPFLLIQNDFNMGQSFSRNLAVSRANSEVVIFFDDDDEASYHRAGSHLNLHNEGAEFSYTSSEKIYSASYVVKNVNSEVSPTAISISNALDYLFTGKPIVDIGIFYVPSSTLAVNRAKFLALGGFDTSYRRLEDVDLFLRAASAGYIFSWSSEIAVKRYHSVRADKGAGIDSKFEFQLLEKYKVQLGGRKYKLVRSLMKLRESYFTKDIPLLLKTVFTNPFALAILVYKVPVLIKRLYHDYCQRILK